MENSLKHYKNALNRLSPGFSFLSNQFPARRRIRGIIHNSPTTNDFKSYRKKVIGFIWYIVYTLLETFLFETVGRRHYGLFFSEKVGAFSFLATLFKRSDFTRDI